MNEAASVMDAPSLLAEGMLLATCNPGTGLTEATADSQVASARAQRPGALAADH